ncbi:GTPase IMAP family member 7-like [Cololabis saira]|uniref:GTPase IMAP family member 7-like n=1 Tax=Cololabis saira TaxID=129043 RepID=UPI002AD57919|nr:GTPase IMAP family member 7-like [Cololabis saira]
MVPGVNIVLLGMTGTGKSASANAILGRDRFPSRASSMPVTTEVQRAETEVKGICMQVIDTPDMFDEDMQPSLRAKLVEDCKRVCGSGSCVYLLVMHVSRFTDGERDILTKMERAFGRHVSERTVVLFTRGEDLRRAGLSLDDFLRSSHPGLQKIVQKCGNRCVLFEKSRSNQSQVEELLETVSGMMKRERVSTNSEEGKMGWWPGLITRLIDLIGGEPWPADAGNFTPRSSQMEKPCGLAL